MGQGGAPTQVKTIAGYDEMPYVPAAFPQSHPDRLATLAKLFGIATPAIDTCRVLELGCAAGDNLVPMAFGLPEAHFVGVDLSERQIAQGRGLIAELQLTNIELRHADIADVDTTWGSFDYIVCHGVYSWVPESIRARILTICRENLAPDGVAYVSYNTLPGWRIRGMVRDMMVYHADQFTDAGTKVAQARSLLDFLAQSATTDAAYGMALKAELDSIRQKADAYLFHDHLEPVNDALYFHQFATAARREGLQYLGEASLRDMMVSNLPPQVAETLRRIAPDMIRLEQYMDFVRNRMFRQTLLVHDNVAIKRRLDWQSLRDCEVASAAKPASDKPVLAQDAPESFHTEEGGTFTTANAIAKAAMLLLRERWPRSIPFAELVVAAGARLQAEPTAVTADSPAQDVEMLAVTLLQCFAAGAIELHVWSPTVSPTPSSRPTASALARIHARRDGPVTNLRHEPVKIDGAARVVLQLADGTRDRAALIAALTDLVHRGSLRVRHQQSGEALTTGPMLAEALGRSVDESLSTLARSALLVE